MLIYFELFSLTYFIMNKSSYIPNTNKNNIKNSKLFKFKFIKQNLINNIFKAIKKNLTHTNSIYITGKARFGNFLIAINNAIIACELLNCKKIIIQNNKYLFINHRIFYPKYNITIQPNQTFMDNDSIILNNWFFYFFKIHCFGYVNRLNILKDEILNNLPKIKIHRDDLYIYIRSGDVFSTHNKWIYLYPQPPLCFYENILKTFNFRLVNIISEDNFNPVIPILLKKYSFIKFNRYSIKNDIAYLANSFNLVSAMSSFLISIIKLNDKIQFLWEYDFYTLPEKYKHLHHSVYSYAYNYTIYKMEPSLKYQKFMYPWNNTKEQIEMMIKEKCKKHFTIIKPRI